MVVALLDQFLALLDGDPGVRKVADDPVLSAELLLLFRMILADGTVSESDLKTRLTALQEVESRSAAEMRKAYDGIDEVLDVFQQARFRVFEEQIERRKLELIMRARQQNRQMPPRRPPGF